MLCSCFPASDQLASQASASRPGFVLFSYAMWFAFWRTRTPHPPAPTHIETKKDRDLQERQTHRHRQTDRRTHAYTHSHSCGISRYRLLSLALKDKDRLHLSWCCYEVRNLQFCFQGKRGCKEPGRADDTAVPTSCICLCPAVVEGSGRGLITAPLCTVTESFISQGRSLGTREGRQDTWQSLAAGSAQRV